MDMLELIKERTNCTDEMADEVMSYLEKIDPTLQKALIRWCENEKDIDNDTVVEGYTIAKLMKDYDMQFTGAILTMDGLIKQPAITKQLLTDGICL